MFFVVNVVISGLEFNVFIKGTDIINEPQYSVVGQSIKSQWFDVFKFVFKFVLMFLKVD